MKLEEVRQAYYKATGQVSALVQSSSLGGLAVVWLLSSGSMANIKGTSLKWALWCFVIALALNFAQFLYRSAAYGLQSRLGEQRKKREKPGETLSGEFELGDMPEWINRWTITLFVAKSAFMVIGFVMLGSHAMQ
jgi:hypothetical protein